MILKLNGKWNVSSLRRNPAKATNPTHQISFVYLRADKHQTAAKQSGQKNDWMTLGYTDIQIYRYTD